MSQKARETALAERPSQTRARAAASLLAPSLPADALRVALASIHKLVAFERSSLERAVGSTARLRCPRAGSGAGPRLGEREQAKPNRAARLNCAPSSFTSYSSRCRSMARRGPGTPASRPAACPFPPSRTRATAAARPVPPPLRAKTSRAAAARARAREQAERVHRAGRARSSTPAPTRRASRRAARERVQLSSSGPALPMLLQSGWAGRDVRCVAGGVSSRAGSRRRRSSRSEEGLRGVVVAHRDAAGGLADLGVSKVGRTSCWWARKAGWERGDEDEGESRRGPGGLRAGSGRIRSCSSASSGRAARLGERKRRRWLTSKPALHRSLAAGSPPHTLELEHHRAHTSDI